MPARLQQIYEEVGRFEPPSSNLETLRPVWRAYVSRAGQVPGVHVEADGETLYLGELSPGCRACKEGTWDCIFVTMRCNLDCDFCYSPHSIPKDYAGSGFGANPEQIGANHARTRITGVSFSGGEPFLELQRLFAWLDWFKSRWPERYYWVYTNGLLADAQALRRLGELGLDEIRFNTAATGYDHPTVMRNLAAAAELIPNVTVEIPAIPDHTEKLLASLAEWSARGVRFLNLHELMYEPGTNAASMPGARQVVVTEDGHCTEVNPESRVLTLAVLVKVREDGLPLAVNDCSLQSKLRQVRGRWRSLAPLIQAPYERAVEERAYESWCAYRGEEAHFFHPDALDEMRRRYSDYRFVRLVRMAPLSVGDRGRWIVCEEINEK